MHFCMYIVRNRCKRGTGLQGLLATAHSEQITIININLLASCQVLSKRHGTLGTARQGPHYCCSNCSYLLATCSPPARYLLKQKPGPYAACSATTTSSSRRSRRGLTAVGVGRSVSRPLREGVRLAMYVTSQDPEV